MEFSMNNNFCELNETEIMMVDGGGWTQALAAFGGTLCIGLAPVAGVVAGIGGSVVATPVVGVCAGIGAGSAMVAAGASMLDYACK